MRFQRKETGIEIFLHSTFWPIHQNTVKHYISHQWDTQSLSYCHILLFLSIAYPKYWYQDSIQRDPVYHSYSWQTIHPFIRTIFSSNLWMATSTLYLIKTIWFTEEWKRQNSCLRNQNLFWDAYNGGIIFRMQNNPIPNVFTQCNRATWDPTSCR